MDTKYTVGDSYRLVRRLDITDDVKVQDVQSDWLH